MASARVRIHPPTRSERQLSSGYQVCADLDSGMSIEAVTLKDLMPMTNMTLYEKARVLDLMIMSPAHTQKYYSWLNGA